MMPTPNTSAATNWDDNLYPEYRDLRNRADMGANLGDSDRSRLDNLERAFQNHYGGTSTTSNDAGMGEAVEKLTAAADRLRATTPTGNGFKNPDVGNRATTGTNSPADAGTVESAPKQSSTTTTDVVREVVRETVPDPRGTQTDGNTAPTANTPTAHPWDIYPTVPDDVPTPSPTPNSPQPQPTVTEIGTLVREAVRDEIPTPNATTDPGGDKDTTPGTEAGNTSFRGPDSNPLGTTTDGLGDIGRIIGEIIAKSMAEKLTELITASLPKEPPKPDTGGGLWGNLKGPLSELFPHVGQMADRLSGVDSRLGGRISKITNWFTGRDGASANGGGVDGQLARASKPEADGADSGGVADARDVVTKGTDAAVETVLNKSRPEESTGSAGTVGRSVGRIMKRIGGSKAGKVAKSVLKRSASGRAAMRFGSSVATRLAGSAASAGTAAAGASAAGTAAAGAGATAGASAAGAGTAAAGAGTAASAAAVVNPVVAVAVAAAAVGAALKGMNDAVADSTKELLNYNRQVGQFSGMMQTLFAEMDAREAGRSRQTGDRLEDSARFLAEQDQFRKDNNQEIKVLAGTLENLFTGVANDVVTLVVAPLNELAGGLNWIVKKMKLQGSSTTTDAAGAIAQQGADLNQGAEREARVRDRVVDGGGRQ
jgi:hypothetical protein